MTTTELKTNLLASTVNEVETACKSLSLEELAKR